MEGGSIINILYVHEEFPEETNFGGIATYQKIVATEMAKRGNKVFVICRGLKKSYHYIENGVQVYRIHVKKSNLTKDYILYRTKVAKLIKKIMKQNAIDIIETPDWGAETRFLRHRNIPLVVRLHTPLKIWLNYNNNDFGKIKNSMLKWEKENLFLADEITCCSEFLKNKMRNYFSLNKPITVIYNPMNTKTFFQKLNNKKDHSLLFVGSLEERKGVLVLARALNFVFEKYPNLKIKFVGKDTKRNQYNKSTKKLIYKIVDKKYHNNILFLGQLKNSELNNYYNQSNVAIFPSLFDNLPYVVMEAMSTGIHVVGSQNSGMVEMLEDSRYIYETGNFNDLAEKIIFAYNQSLKNTVNKNNICLVHNKFNPVGICNTMDSLYRKCINIYQMKKILSLITTSSFTNITRLCGGLANEVFMVETKDRKKYVIKRYLHKYDFSLAEELYNIYINNKILISKPINHDPILHHGYFYNVFPYIETIEKNDINDMEYYAKLLNCNRKTRKKPNLIEKCDRYYFKLKEKKHYNGIENKYIKTVLEKYEFLRNKSLFLQQYLNHGDISVTNILKTKKDNVVIDFDEITVTTKLYDFAVIVVKNFVVDSNFDVKKIKTIYSKLDLSFSQYNYSDYIDVLKLYLIKILLEKFYLHCIERIDLFDAHQQKDDFRRYYKLLERLCKGEENV